MKTYTLYLMDRDRRDEWIPLFDAPAKSRRQFMKIHRDRIAKCRELRDQWKVR